MLPALINLYKSLNNRWNLIVTCDHYEHFFWEKSKFQFFFNGKMIFGIIRILDQSSLLQYIDTDFPPESAFRIRSKNRAFLPSAPDDVNKCDSLYSDGFQGSF